MKKPLLLFLMLLPVLLFGQYAPSIYDGPLSIQVQTGTQGVGADLRYGLLTNLSLRAGACFIPVSLKNVYDISDFESQNNAEAKFSNVHFLADFVPFKATPGFRLVGGAGYLFKAKGGLDITPTGTYKFGEINLTAEQVGHLNVDVSWKGIAPYAGIGLFKSFPNNLFNVNLDLGTYYLTAPKANVMGTGLLSGNNTQSELISSNVSDYRWLPVLQLNFNFKLK